MDNTQRHVQSTPQPATAKPGQDTVTAVIRHEVRTEARTAYEDWLRKIIPVATGFPGHLGVTVIRPAEGESAYAITLRFTTLEAAQAWLKSGERAQLLDEAAPHLTNPENVQTVAGLEFWFDTPNGPPRVRQYKQFLLALSALFPLSFFVQWAFGSWVDLVPALRHPVVQRLVLTAIMAALMTYVVMPRYSKLVGSWLYR